MPSILAVKTSVYATPSPATATSPTKTSSGLPQPATPSSTALSDTPRPNAVPFNLINKWMRLGRNSLTNWLAWERDTFDTLVPGYLGNIYSLPPPLKHPIKKLKMTMLVRVKRVEKGKVSCRFVVAPSLRCTSFMRLIIFLQNQNCKDPVDYRCTRVYGGWTASQQGVDGAVPQRAPASQFGFRSCRLDALCFRGMARMGDPWR